MMVLPVLRKESEKKRKEKKDRKISIALTYI